MSAPQVLHNEVLEGCQIEIERIVGGEDRELRTIGARERKVAVVALAASRV